MDEPTVAQTLASTTEETQLPTGIAEAFVDLMNGNFSQATTGLILKIVIPAAAAVLMFIVTYFIARLAARWVAAVMCRRIDQTLGKFAGNFTFYSILILVSLTILQTAQVNVTGFAAIIAAAGFAIGLAFQGTLSNFAAGILLLVFRPFKVGDIVNAAGVMGKVNEIDLFTTTLDTPDNRRLIVPNSSIAGTTIENITFHKQRRIDVPVGVSYAASLDETRHVLTSCAESLGEKVVCGEGRGYQILLTNLGPSSVEWTVRVWADSKAYFAVKEELTAEIKRQLDLNGLEIPFPQMQLHLKDSDPATVRVMGKHSSLPIPKMATDAMEHRSAGKVRPRARGDNGAS